MAEQIDLVYPLYLDVPMMTSFVAALEDGIAYGSDVTQMKNQRRTVASEGEGKAGAGIPGMGIFSTLLNIDLRGKIQGEQAAGSDEEVRLVRRHTEASLFMRLRHTLANDNRILQIQELDDLRQLENAEQEYLVEIRGQISRSPLHESLETVFRMLSRAPSGRYSRAKAITTLKFSMPEGRSTASKILDCAKSSLMRCISCRPIRPSSSI